MLKDYMHKGANTMVTSEFQRSPTLRDHRQPKPEATQVGRYTRPAQMLNHHLNKGDS